MTRLMRTDTISRYATRHLYLHCSVKYQTTQKECNLLTELQRHWSRSFFVCQTKKYLDEYFLVLISRSAICIPDTPTRMRASSKAKHVLNNPTSQIFTSGLQ